MKAGWAFTRYNNEPMQDFGPKMGVWVDAMQWAFTRHFSVLLYFVHAVSTHVSAISFFISYMKALMEEINAKERADDDAQEMQVTFGGGQFLHRSQ